MTFIDFITDPATIEAAQSTAWCFSAVILVSASAMGLAFCWRRL